MPTTASARATKGRQARDDRSVFPSAPTDRIDTRFCAETTRSAVKGYPAAGTSAIPVRRTNRRRSRSRHAVLGAHRPSPGPGRRDRRSRLQQYAAGGRRRAGTYCWMQAARGKRDSIRSYRAPPRAQVKRRARLRRSAAIAISSSRGLTNAELFLDGRDAPIATRSARSTDLLRRRLGMTRDEFFNTYFTGQKELGVMAAMGPSERAQFLSRVLGYERLHTAQELIRERRSIARGRDRRRCARACRTRTSSQRALAEAEARARRGRSARRVRDRERAIARAPRSTRSTPRWERLQREREQSMQALVAELRVAESERGARAARRRAHRARAGRDCARRAELDALDAAQLAPLRGARGRAARARDGVERRGAPTRRSASALRRSTEEVARARPSAARRSRRRRRRSRRKRAGAGAERAELEDVQAQFEVAQTEWVRDKQEAETKREALLAAVHGVQAAARADRRRSAKTASVRSARRPLGTHFRSGARRARRADRDDQRSTASTFAQRIEQLAAMPAGSRGAR